MEFALEGTILLILITAVQNLAFPVTVLIGSIIAAQNSASWGTTLLLVGSIVMVIAAIPSTASVFILRITTPSVFSQILMGLGAVNTIAGILFAIGFIKLAVSQQIPKSEL